MDGRFDDLLLGMAQKHKGIEDLLYSFMSFFERRTDLFHLKEGDETKGFEEGKSEEMLRKHFSTFQARYLSRAQPHLLVQQSGLQEPMSSGHCKSSERLQDSDGSSGGAPASTGEAPEQPSQELPMGMNASPLDGGDPGLWEKQRRNAEGFNWTQSVSEVTAEIDVEKCNASDIKVTFAPKKICVKRKGEVIIEGRLHDKISCEDSTWHLDSGKQIVLSLEKIRPMFWNGFFEDAPSGGSTAHA
mmetsp:Transcript_83240/g.165265  ORF Transcript_83240/g.165265 Transcript_83240/m.165265 type:complete len:244 (-) Transcript_83240:40-771(-)